MRSSREYSLEENKYYKTSGLRTDMSEGNDGGTTWRSVDAVKTSCRILEELYEMDEAGVTELADRLDVSKAGVHSHLATLREEEFVVKDGDKYKLSLRFLDFGEVAKRDIDVYDVVETEVARLSERTGEVAQFMIEEHGWGIYIAKERGESGVKTAAYVGARKHLHCTGVGKAILANLPRDQVDEIIEKRGLPAKTENTITDREELYEELESIRSAGVAFDDEEILHGVRCVAVPVVSQRKGLLGAISISGPTSRLKGDYFRDELPDIVTDSSNVIQINAEQL
jgi:DNA-binding IclR family transcriptional regulator